MQADDLHLQGIPCSRQKVSKNLSPARRRLQRLPTRFQGGPTLPGQHVGVQHVLRVSVVRVRPRTSGGITDLLSTSGCVYLVAYTAPLRSNPRRSGARAAPTDRNGSHGLPVPRTPYLCSRPAAIGRQRSRSLSESTRQITPPTRSGHAPPFRESRKGSRSVNPCRVRIR